ncbi:Ig-like domain-containing protein [Imperialibacter sp.]|uniref:Ig-like domain-containing protein n=1 Tax=Imperialibacter sp. TaxID=2038411 RepID=UPI0032ED692B
MTSCGPEDGDDDLDEDQDIVPVVLSFEQQSMIVLMGDSIQLGYQVKPDTANVSDMVWTSSHPEVATVDAGGMLRGLTLGDTEIKVSSEKEKAEASLNVSVVPVPLTNILLEPDVIIATIGQPTTLDITFDPPNASNRSVVWRVNDPQVASVTQEGVLTVLKHGFVWVSAEQGNDFSDYQTVIPVASGQIMAASHVNSSKADGKHYIDVFVGSLAEAVTVNEIKVYLKGKEDPATTELRTVIPNLTFAAGEAGEIPIEVTATEADQLTYGRHVRLAVTTAGKSYYVYLSWFNVYEEVER